MLDGKHHYNHTNVDKCVTNWWKSSGQFKMADYITGYIIIFGVQGTKTKANLNVISKHFEH